MHAVGGGVSEAAIGRLLFGMEIVTSEQVLVRMRERSFIKVKFTTYLSLSVNTRMSKAVRTSAFNYYG